MRFFFKKRNRRTIENGFVLIISEHNHAMYCGKYNSEERRFLYTSIDIYDDYDYFDEKKEGLCILSQYDNLGEKIYNVEPRFYWYYMKLRNKHDLSIMFDNVIIK